MNIEHDLQAFKELAIELQPEIPFALLQNDNADQLKNELEPILFDIVDGEDVSVQGDVYLPRISEVGIVVGAISTHQEVTGSLRGLYVGPRVDPENKPLDDSEFVFCYQVALHGIRRTSGIEDTISYLSAFAPIESNTLKIPGKMIDQLDFGLGYDEDLIEEIDTIIFNSPFAINSLDTLFNKIAEQNIFLADSYTRYLNEVFDLKEFELDLSSDSLLQVIDNNAYKELASGQKQASGQIQVEGYTYDPDAGGLCMYFREDKTKYLIPLSKITDIEMRLV